MRISARKRLTYHLTLLGLGFAALFWVLESALDAFVFHEGTFWEHAFAPSADAVWIRLLVVSLLIAFAMSTGLTVARRRRTEEALQATEARFFTTLNSIGDAVIAADPEGRVSFMNPIAEELTGWKGGEAAGRPLPQVFDIVNEDTGQRAEDPVTRVIREGVVVGLADHTVLIAKDGARRPVDDSGAPIRDADGEVTGAVLVFRDVTERRRAEEKARHLNAVLRAVRDVNQLITKERDRDGLLKGVCDILVQTRGYRVAWIALFDERGEAVTTAEAGLGEDFTLIVELLGRGERPECCRRALAGPGVATIRRPPDECPDCPLGSRHVGTSALAVRLEHGGKVYGALVVCLPGDFAAYEEELSLFEEVAGDIAFALRGIELEGQRKRAEETLRAERDKLTGVLDAMEDGVYIVDRQNDFQYVNPALARSFGDWEGRKCYEYFHDLKEVCPWCKNVDVYAGKTVRWEWHSFKNGRSYDLVDTPLRNPDGSVHKLEIFRDITERKRLEREILDISAREQRRIRQDLHDGLGQLLTGISLMSGALAQKLAAKSSPESAEAKKIEGFVSQAIGQTRDIAKAIHPVAPVPDGLVVALQQMASNAEEIFGIRCVFRCDEPVLIHDSSAATHLYRITQEAVSNAVRHGGAKHVDIHLAAVADGITLTVADEGTGIPEESERGEGLGLRIMDHRAKMIGGTLTVRRGPAGGTVVSCSVRSKEGA